MHTAHEDLDRIIVSTCNSLGYKITTITDKNCSICYSIDYQPHEHNSYLNMKREYIYVHITDNLFSIFVNDVNEVKANVYDANINDVLFSFFYELFR